MNDDRLWDVTAVIHHGPYIATEQHPDTDEWSNQRFTNNVIGKSRRAMAGPMAKGPFGAPCKGLETEECNE